jgi:hypothetical protein
MVLVVLDVLAAPSLNYLASPTIARPERTKRDCSVTSLLLQQTAVADLTMIAATTYCILLLAVSSFNCQHQYFEASTRQTVLKPWTKSAGRTAA